jgi:hypothetical protein
MLLLISHLRFFCSIRMEISTRQRAASSVLVALGSECQGLVDWTNGPRGSGARELDAYGSKFWRLKTYSSRHHVRGCCSWLWLSVTWHAVTSDPRLIAAASIGSSKKWPLYHSLALGIGISLVIFQWPALTVACLLYISEVVCQLYYFCSLLLPLVALWNASGIISLLLLLSLLLPVLLPLLLLLLLPLLLSPLPVTSSAYFTHDKYHKRLLRKAFYWAWCCNTRGKQRRVFLAGSTNELHILVV